MKKYLAFALALVMLAVMFVLPTSAAQEPDTTFNIRDSYEMILGKKELSNKLFSDPWDWTTTDGYGPNTPNWNNFGADGKLPAVRIQTIYVPADQTFAEGEVISLNWYLVKSNLHQAICLKYDLGTGVVSGMNYDFLSIVDYTAPVPEADRTGLIQFVTTMKVEDDGNVTESTYANGVLVLRRHTHDGAGATLNGGVTYQYACMNNDTTAFNASSDAYLNKGVETVNFLFWSTSTTTVTNSDFTAAGLYNLFARYYGKDVVWYPQDVTKNGMVVGQGGIRYYVDGVYQTGMISSRYYYKETGYLATEDLIIGGKAYYFTANNGYTSGRMKVYTGVRGNYYYTKGVKTGGWVDYDGDGNYDAYYYLESKEKCTTSRKIGGVYYEYNPKTDTLSKVQGLIDEGDDTFYLIDGVKATGWQEIDGDMCYFYKETGVMVLDATITILGVPHTFDADGICIDYVAD